MGKYLSNLRKRMFKKVISTKLSKKWLCLSHADGTIVKQINFLSTQKDQRRGSHILRSLWWYTSNSVSSGSLKTWLTKTLYLFHNSKFQDLSRQYLSLTEVGPSGYRICLFQCTRSRSAQQQQRGRIFNTYLLIISVSFSNVFLQGFIKDKETLLIHLLWSL